MKPSAVFQYIVEMIKTINVPSNWFSDVQLLDYPNKRFVGFYKLGNARKTFLRHVEKQLGLTEGKY